MQINSNKAIANFLLFIGVIGFFMTFFLIFILDTTYKQDPIECEEVDISVGFCEDKSYRAIITNKNENKNVFVLVESGKFESISSIEAGNKKIVQIQESQIGSSIKVTPTVKNALGKQVGVCSNKKVSYKTNLIGKCTN